jgi:hypothetical protein
MSQIKTFLVSLLEPCGCAVLPLDVKIVPSPQVVKQLVSTNIPDIGKHYLMYTHKYKRGMSASRPNHYVCKEVLRKGTKEGYLTLMFGVDDDKQVRTAALLAATNEDVRSHIKDEVWEELEPGLAEKADEIPQEKVRAKVLEGARKASDEAVDKCIDEYFKVWAEKIKKGEDPFPNNSANF